MIINYCYFQIVIKLDKVWRHLFFPPFSEGSCGDLQICVLDPSTQYSSAPASPLQKLLVTHLTKFRYVTAPSEQLQQCGNNSSTLAHAHPYTPLIH